MEKCVFKHFEIFLRDRATVGSGDKALEARDKRACGLCRNARKMYKTNKYWSVEKFTHDDLRQAPMSLF